MQLLTVLKGHFSSLDGGAGGFPSEQEPGRSQKPERVSMGEDRAWASSFLFFPSVP